MFIAPVAAGRPGPLAQIDEGGGIELNLINVPVRVAASAVLGELLGVPFLVEDAVQGNVTLRTTAPVDNRGLLDIFRTALELNGATLRQSDSAVVIAPLSRGPGRFSTRTGSRFGNPVVIIPLEYISAAEMTRLLDPIIGGTITVSTDEARNLLMVSGSAGELDAVVEAVNIFDIDVLAGKSVALFPLDSASPAAVGDELTSIFDSGPGGTLDGVVTFLPNERLRSILVITSRDRYIDEARSWIAQLDSTAGRADRFARVYELRNRTAEDLEPILAQLIVEEARETDPAAAGFGLPDLPARVVADSINNAIVAYADARDHEQIAVLIGSLDTTPPQVLIEATIAEVALTDELDLGVRWFFESGNFALRFSDLSTGAAAPSFPGFSALFDGGDAIVALNALSAITNVEVASSPSLLVLDNREAELRVGDQVPVATQTATDVTNPTAPVVNEIDFRDTGVILKIRPRVGEGGRILMDIEQEVSDVASTTTSGIDSPTISQRFVRTSVAVNSGETLALGGLIENSDQTVNRQVPLLGDIPGLGAAFRSRTSEIQRTELLILITPRVVRDGLEARRATEEIRSRLSGPNGLVDGFSQPRHVLDRAFD